MLPDDNHDRPWWGLPCTVRDSDTPFWRPSGAGGQSVALPCRPRRYQRPVQRCGCIPSGPSLSTADETTGTHVHQRWTESPSSADRHAVCEKDDRWIPPSVRTGTFASDEKARTALCHTDRHNNTEQGINQDTLAAIRQWRTAKNPSAINFFYSQNNRRWEFYLYPENVWRSPL